jgi:hypothetical protein
MIDAFFFQRERERERAHGYGVFWVGNCFLGVVRYHTGQYISFSSLFVECSWGRFTLLFGVSKNSASMSSRKGMTMCEFC